MTFYKHTIKDNIPFEIEKTPIINLKRLKTNPILNSSHIKYINMYARDKRVMKILRT